MSVVHADLVRDGQVAHVRLARPKANVLDHEMTVALREALARFTRRGPLKMLLLDHEGPHFSFGASVEEHLPGRYTAMLTSFHTLLRAVDDLGVPTVAAVRGQCLGGGLELALVAGRIVSTEGASLGNPEVKLGVFAPAASVLLPLRVRPVAATELLLGGRSVGGPEALSLGLVDELAEDPTAAAFGWFDRTLGPLSAVAVRAAWYAARAPWRRALGPELDAVEHQYTASLMSHADPVEGLSAFLERRAPTWSHE